VTAVLGFLGRILEAVLGNSSLTQEILRLLGLPAQEDTVNLAVVASQATLSEVDNVTYGLAVLETEHVAILAAIAGVESLITSALAILDGFVADGVPLPAVPPSGYGVDVTDIASAVWNESQPAIPSTPIDALLQVARSLNTTADFDMGLYVGMFRVSRFDWPANGFYITSIEYPIFDPTDILPTETLLTCLTRQNPTWVVGNAWAPQDVVSLDPTSGGQAHFTTLIGEADFQQIKASLYPALALNELPLWPGVANVTFGSPVALDVSGTITEQMDGVVISITSVPLKQGSFGFDTLTSWRNVGAIAFLSDDGEAEFPQTLGFNSAIFTPKAMAHAAGLVFRTTIGVSGTITPWTVNPIL
jgi:hypothetical protein